MIANYHTHTARCNHAVGRDEEYVLQAVAAGFRTLGFSDHAPYPFAGGYYLRSRMAPELLPDYTQSVASLREQYKDQIQIRLGVEAEYFPQFWAEQVAMLRDHGVEYILLGQHWGAYREDGVFCGNGSDDAALLAEHCGAVREAVQTGLITYIAHPDVFRFTGEDRVYDEHIRPVCREAKACGIPLEVNLLGLRTGRHYPTARFWEIAAEEGCPVVLGCDAHAPQWLNAPEVEARALEWVRQYDLHLLEDIDLRPLG